ncbi:hypothetical protein BDN67DRAFT_1012379 [Paxillus ammoniavirescens]|nr:hypothetical protein BDN67DRAFT_1012379 [Paxillus ammoniavirescens]
MVELAGDYVLELSQAREWANRRFPDIKWHSNEHLLHGDIRRRLNMHYKDDFDLDRCLIISWEEGTECDAGVFFPVLWHYDRKATREKHKHFRECKSTLAVKKELFEPVEEDLPCIKDIRFVTIYDPYEC